MRRIRFHGQRAEEDCGGGAPAAAGAPDPPAGLGLNRHAHGLRHPPTAAHARWLVDGRPVKSCTMLAVQVDGREISTVEGPWPPRASCTRCRRASRRSTACSAGFCTPGDDDGRQGPAGREPRPERGRRPAGRCPANLCRCTGYQNIVKSVLWGRRQAPACACPGGRPPSSTRPGGTTPGTPRPPDSPSLRGGHACRRAPRLAGEINGQEG